MSGLYYIGLDIHKKTIAYCIKKIDGTLVQQGTVPGGQALYCEVWLFWHPPNIREIINMLNILIFILLFNVKFTGELQRVRVERSGTV